MDNKIRRVAVTGIGAVTPIGLTADESWKAMIEGKNGIAPITLFDTANFKTKLAAEVKGFDPHTILEKNDIIKTDRYSMFGLAAAQEAVDDSGILGTVDPDRFAVYFGSGIGGISSFAAEHTKLMEKGPRRVSPYFVPMMIANMAAGMIAIRFNCQGAALPAVTACASAPMP